MIIISLDKPYKRHIMGTFVGPLHQTWGDHGVTSQNRVTKLDDPGSFCGSLMVTHSNITQSHNGNITYLMETSWEYTPYFCDVTFITPPRDIVTLIFVMFDGKPKSYIVLCHFWRHGSRSPL